MNLNKKYWDLVSQYIPEKLKKEIEREQWVIRYKGKKELKEITVKIENNSELKVLGEELSHNWFITPTISNDGEKEDKFYSLTHISGKYLARYITSRRQALRLWSETKHIISEIVNIEKFVKTEEFNTLYKIVKEFTC